MKFLYLLICLSFLCISPISLSAQQLFNCTETDTLTFINCRFNAIQYYNPTAFSKFFEQWSSKSKKVIIATLGDSHLQSGYYPNALKKELVKFKGDGGIGFLFNYSAAETYGSDLYKSMFTGKWTNAKSRSNNPKLPIGFSGMTLNTSDQNASLTFKFKEQINSKYNILRLFAKYQPSSFDLTLKTEFLNQKIILSDTHFNLPFFQIKLPESEEIKLFISKTNPTQSSFEFYGMSLENANDTGVIVYNAGVGAAQYSSILKESLFEDQIKVLNPSLVVIDFGTNDFLYDDLIKSDLEITIRKVISKVRLSLPNASIILATAMDMEYKGKPLQSEIIFSKLIYKIAEDENLCIFDWFEIAGGDGSINAFLANNLAQKDKIHLTSKGYRLKGRLLAYALINAIEHYKTNSNAALIIKN